MDKKELKRICKGRTPEQIKCIKYFNGTGGCLSKAISDSEYDALLAAKVKSLNTKQKALGKIGLDEAEVSEIAPVHFEGYNFETSNNNYAKRGKDNIWRSSQYQITWLFFSATQVYMYCFSFSMTEDGIKERTEEYFYKDITNFSTSNESVEKEVLDKVSCTGNATYKRLQVESARFSLIVPGDKFYCAMTPTDKTEAAIRGMKAKLREKKL